MRRTGRRQFPSLYSRDCPSRKCSARVSSLSSSRESRSTTTISSSSKRCGLSPSPPPPNTNTRVQGFVVPLTAARPPIVPPDRLNQFLTSILLNFSEIRLHSRQLLDALLDRQRQQPHIVKGVGDVVLAAALDWGPAYTAYTVNFPMADSLFKEEKARNPRFNEFLAVRPSPLLPLDSY
jgi:hypothetical protein